MALTPQAIQRFIPAGSPLGRAGGANVLLRATGGNLAGAAFLAALARKESSFGAQAFAPNNFWGWGVHLGPEVNTAPSVEAMAARVWKGLTGGLYRGAGLVTPSAIINRYAPPSENNTSLYQQQVNSWFRELGLSPQTNIFSGQSVPVPPAQQGRGGLGGFVAPARGRGVDGLAMQQVPPIRLNARQQRALDEYLHGSAEDVLAGRTPRDAMGVVSMIQQATEARNRQYQGQVTDYQGRLQTEVNTGLATVGAPAPGGGWGGTQGPAEEIARISGLPVTSTKRTRKFTASGGVSDHWTGSTNSYAVDLGTSGAAGDRAFAKIMRALGQPNLRPGQWHDLNIGGFRYQIGWRVPWHYDHIHVGVKRL